MQIALLGNPGLQAAYAGLGISEAERVQAGRLPNPGFGFSRSSGGEALEIDRALSFSVGAILTMPLRVSMENRRFEAAKLQAAVDTLDVALGAREAYFGAVAARQATLYAEQILEAAEATRELTRRMARIGSASKLDLAREQLFHAESTVALLRSRQREVAARESLARALGLFGDQLAFTLPDRLPELPPRAEEMEDVEQAAVSRRLDVQLARMELESLTRSMNLTSSTHFISLLEEAGPIQVRDRGEAARNGYEIAIELPVFDAGDARLAKARALHMRGVQRLREAAINARSQAREAYQGYRSAYDVAALYRDRIVPLRARISEEQLLRYNGMLIGVFELLQDAREQVQGVSQAMRAELEFWLADTALKRAVLGAGMPAAGMSSGADAAPMAAAPAH
jgi:outer membrane protein TolC